MGLQLSDTGNILGVGPSFIGEWGLD
jgi:hypothetical protein